MFWLKNKICCPSTNKSSHHHDQQHTLNKTIQPQIASFSQSLGSLEKFMPWWSMHYSLLYASLHPWELPSEKDLYLQLLVPNQVSCPKNTLEELYLFEAHRRIKLLQTISNGFYIPTPWGKKENEIFTSLTKFHLNTFFQSTSSSFGSLRSHFTSRVHS